MIEINHLDKSFGDHHVLSDINLKFERGQCNLIIGASGSGKTTLTKCLVGLHEFDSGDIKYDGRSIKSMDFQEFNDLRKEIGFLFQNSALFDSMTVEENVKFPLRMNANMSEEEMTDRVNYCLERVVLAGKNDLYPDELSGGMKKRVGIARAIALNPKYLFCDEPNSGLDPQTAITIDQLIASITKEMNITTVVITHDMNSVLEIGDNICFLYKGKIDWVGNKHEIMQTDTQELVNFVFASDFMRAIRDRFK